MRAGAIVPLLLGALACGGASTDGWTWAEPTPLEPPDEVAEPPPEPPRPTIEIGALLEYEGPAPATGMPARADNHVALPVVHHDTARGNPNLTVRVVEARSGDLVWEAVVLTPGEFAGAESPGALRSLVEPRARQAQSRLDAEGFEPLTALYVPETPGDGVVEAVGAGVVLRWDPDTGVLLARAGDESLLARLEVEAAPPVEEGEACPEAHRPRLAGAWVDGPDGVLVARVAYVGNDACWQPPDRWIVVPLGEGTETEQPPLDTNGA